MRRISLFLTTLVLIFGVGLQAQAATSSGTTVVSSLDCSAIDTGDGDTADWDNIPRLVEPNEGSIEGTLYYFDEDEEDWTTTEPDDYRYSMNVDQWSDITEMGFCNTADEMFMMMSQKWPMFTYYDNDEELYIDIWWETEDFGTLTLPKDYEAWMVWKMQKEDGTGAVTYFAADISLSKGNSQMDEDHPKLYIYEDSDCADGECHFDEVDFDANVDTKLAKVEPSDDGGDTGEPDCSKEGEESEGEEEQEECSMDPSDVGFSDVASQGFEVRQNIIELFENSDFKYGDTVNMSVSMYNTSDFSTASTVGMTAAATTDTGVYKFTKRGVRSLEKQKGTTVKEQSVKVRWNKFKTKGKFAKHYTVKVFNSTTGKLVKNYKGVKRNKLTVRGLKADTRYRANVRAVKKGTFKKKNNKFSAWSSGYSFTTATE